MAKRKHSTRPTAAKAGFGSAIAAAPVRNWAQACIAAAGVMVTALLLWDTYAQTGLPYCSEGSGCDVVQGSAWSRFLGLPLALWGLVAYGLLGVLAFGGGTRLRRWVASAMLASAGFGTSVYLTAVSLFVIGATCAYCIASLGLMFAALVVVLRRPPTASRRPLWLGAAGAGVLALLMHASASGWLGAGAPADPMLSALARHLEAQGAKFYGASWCPHCQEQKTAFGAAGDELPYIECSPHGPRGPRATDCEMADIRNYPTWIIDGRRHERLLTPEQLARMTGFAWPGHNP